MSKNEKVCDGCGYQNASLTQFDIFLCSACTIEIDPADNGKVKVYSKPLTGKRKFHKVADIENHEFRFVKK